jgi:hypothetical protein
MNDDLDGAATLPGLIECQASTARLGDVASDRHSPGVERGELRQRRVGCCPTGAVGEGDPITGPRQCDADALSETSGTAGYQRDA